MKTLNCAQPASTRPAAWKLKGHSPQSPLSSHGTTVLNQTKEEDSIGLALLDKMGDVATQLEKCDGFEESIKTLLIPTLNFYLNHPTL